MPNKKASAKVKARLEALDGLLKVERHKTRSLLADVTSTAETLRAGGRCPEVVRIRRPFYRHDDWVHVEDERYGLQPRALQPRAAQLILPRGIALKMHLVALFAAQCQAAPGHQWHNTIPIEANESSEFSWLGLMAPFARHDPNGRRSSPRENRQRQITEALKKLATMDLVEFPHAGSTRPFREFRLLSEGKRGTTAAPIAYKVPAATATNVLDLPVEFFTKGWVHVLTMSEIVCYLMWLDLNAGRAPEAEAPFIPGLTRAGLFGTTRDTYEAHQQLEAFGLITVEFADGRHGDGKVAKGSDKHCHRIGTIAGALDRDAGPVVHQAVTKYATLGEWVRPVGPLGFAQPGRA